MQGSSPAVTVVIACRERYGLTEAAIDAVVRNISMPIRLIFADVCAPDWLRERLAARAAEWRLEIVRFDEPLWTSEARRRIARLIDTPYAVFMDNDVLVTPGWLERLYECAVETGAGIVGPVYLWGEDARSDTIHMAGGVLKGEQTPAGLVLTEMHRGLGMKIGEVRLVREECDFVEFHCMLMRKEIFQAPNVFDEAIVCVHEHIHACLTARSLGYKIYLEPSVRVTYLSDAPYLLS